MRSKSFDTQEVREIDRKGRRRVERLSHFMNRNNGRCLPDGKKGLQRPRRINNV